MTKYFTFPQIQEALDNLKEVDGKWLLIPLVLAANGVTSASIQTIDRKFGTDAYLDRFFKAGLIGLEPRTPGRSANIRPLFQNLVAERAEDRAKKSEGKLWANGYSQSGYNDWRLNGTLANTTGTDFQLGPNFSSIFRKAVPATFKFESLLTWCYAFSGFDDSINSWAELLADFVKKNTTHNAIATEYQSVFSLTSSEPWPSTFLNQRPSNDEFQEFLLPGAAASHISPQEFRKLRDTLFEKLKTEYLGFSVEELQSLGDSVVSGLQSCKRLFILGEPGAGKSELARVIVAAFKDTFDERVLAITAPISDSTTNDKLVGFSTLDGTWISGILTAKDEDGAELLYKRTGKPGSLSTRAKKQINVLVLDEANRRDIEALLSKIQGALDGASGVPESDEYRVILDNSGEYFLSPNTFIVMTGNSPRDDAGRLVQARPFKRRHNLIAMKNVFTRLLNGQIADFTKQMTALFGQVNPNFQIEPMHRQSFSDAIIAQANDVQMDALRSILLALDEYAIGVTFGLVKKVLLTAAARYGLTQNFSASVDTALTEACLPLMSTENVVNGLSLRERIQQENAQTRLYFPVFFESVEDVLRPVDNFNRVRPFI